MNDIDVIYINNIYVYRKGQENKNCKDIGENTCSMLKKIRSLKKTQNSSLKLPNIRYKYDHCEN